MIRFFKRYHKSMKRFLLIISCAFFIQLSLCAQTFKPPRVSPVHVKIPKVSVEVKAPPSVVPRARKPLVKNRAPETIASIETQVAKQVLKAARKNSTMVEGAVSRLKQSMVQVAVPRRKNGQMTWNGNYASGVLVNYQGKTGVLSAYHVMGPTASERLIRMPDGQGGEKIIPVRVENHGAAGWHEPDVSFAPVKPEDIPAGMIPLTIGEASLQKPAFSAGYITGDFALQDFIPVERTITNMTGNNLYGAYHIAGSSDRYPITGNGQCGSPIIQHFPGQKEEWKLVGIHNGHLLDWDNPAQSRGSGVNLSRVLPQLMEGKYFSRSLTFNGHEVERLNGNERVVSIKRIRPGEKDEEVLLQMFPNPYEDAHAEMAFPDPSSWKSGDILEFTIWLRQEQEPHRTKRVITFMIP